MREHRLVTARRRVDNRKPAMPETRAPPRRINRPRDPNTLIVTPAMLNGVEHRPDQPLRLEANNPRNPTHRNPSTDYTDFQCILCNLWITKSRKGGAREESRAPGTW